MSQKMSSPLRPRRINMLRPVRVLLVLIAGLLTSILGLQLSSFSSPLFHVGRRMPAFQVFNRPTLKPIPLTSPKLTRLPPPRVRHWIHGMVHSAHAHARNPLGWPSLAGGVRHYGTAGPPNERETAGAVADSTSSLATRESIHKFHKEFSDRDAAYITSFGPEPAGLSDSLWQTALEVERARKDGTFLGLQSQSNLGQFLFQLMRSFPPKLVLVEALFSKVEHSMTATVEEGREEMVGWMI